RTTATTRAPAGRSRIVRADFGADPAPPRYRRSQSRATTPPRPTPRDRHSEPWNTPMNPREHMEATTAVEHFKNETEIKAVHPPPTPAASPHAGRAGYGRAILQAGL